MKCRWLLPLVFAVAPLCAQVGQTPATNGTAADLTSMLIQPAIWAGGQLPGEWRSVSSASDKASKELSTLGLVFGVRPQQVQAYLEGGKLARIEVVWLEAGNFFGTRASKEARYRATGEMNVAERNNIERAAKASAREEDKALIPKRKEFAALFQEYERTLPAKITAELHQPGKRVLLGGPGLLRTRVSEWTLDGVNLRFVAEDDQLISLTIQPAADATRRLADQQSGVARRREMKQGVEELPNGDVLITNIPMFNQGGRGYCAIGTLAMVTQFYGLKLNIDQLAAKAGYQDGDTSNAKIRPIYQAAAHEAKLRFSETSKFVWRDALRDLEKGKPLIVWRYFSRERDQVHSSFAKRFAADPAATLPDPRTDKADKATWPAATAGGHASLITGFNKKRDEVIFTESWGESNRNRRMRAAEMEATAYALFEIEP